jgi:O-antigen/teichoic acid export membrane protein
VYDALLLAAATGGFCLAVMVAGEPVMHLLYGGGDYAGHVDIVFTLAAWQFVQAVGIPPSNALAALERARANFWLGLGGNLTSAAAALLLIGPYGPLGAAAGLLVGTAICTALRWGAIVRLHARPEAPQ